MAECPVDFIADDNSVRVIEAFVGKLDLPKLGFEGAEPAATGRPSYHPAELLKVYIYGYLNRVRSSRRLERECQHNIEMMWLTGRLAPHFKTIADFRRDNGAGIRTECRRFPVGGRAGISVLAHRLGGRFKLLRSDRPGRQVAESGDPLAQTQVRRIGGMRVAKARASSASASSVPVMDDVAWNGPGQIEPGQLTGLTHFDSPQWSLP